MCCCWGDPCTVVMVTGGILGRWAGRMRRDSCWAMATRGELSSYERARPPRVNNTPPHTLLIEVYCSKYVKLTVALSFRLIPLPHFMLLCLLQSSPLCTGAYSLSIRDWDDNKGDHVKHYKIRKLDNGGYYITTRSQFDTVQELVEHYTGNTHKHKHVDTDSSSCLCFSFKVKRCLCCHFYLLPLCQNILNSKGEFKPNSVSA